MRSFGIADIERLSGVKAHTLRIWEKRYKTNLSTKTGNGIRQYSAKETERILLLALLNNRGFKISYLLLLSEEEVLAKIQQLNDADCLRKLAVYQLLFRMYAMDIDGYEKLLDNCFFKWPANTVIGEVVHPFLEYACLLWQGSRLVEEHLIVTILRKKLLYFIERLPLPAKPGKTALLFLNGTHQLDLSLLYACYLLRYAGVHVIYMGNDVSINNLSSLFDNVRPDFLYTYLPAKTAFPFEKLAAIMESKIPNGKLVITLQTEEQFIDGLPRNMELSCFAEAMEKMKSA